MRARTARAAPGPFKLPSVLGVGSGAYVAPFVRRTSLGRESRTSVLPVRADPRKFTLHELSGATPNRFPMGVHENVT